MKIIIPAKASSTRVPNKNFRAFWRDKSLVDILIEKLLFSGASNIYLSCEDASKEEVANKYNCNFILRDEKLCHNDTPIPEFFSGVIKQVPGDDDIAWCQVIDPLFNEYKNAFDQWTRRENQDSLVVVYPIKKYLLNQNYIPLNFGFGPWHIKSQNLQNFYEMTFTMSILDRSKMNSCPYYVGSNPMWYHASNSHIDIDTEDEFKMAGIIYEQMRISE